MKKYLCLSGILIATCLFASSASAELPGWYPKSYFIVGFIDRLDRTSIAIDDYPLLLTPTICLTLRPAMFALALLTVANFAVGLNNNG